MANPTLSELTLVHKESMPWLEDAVILVCRSGSHAYGTSLPTSDLDFKGVCVPPQEYFLGFVKKFEQAEQREPVDAVIYDVRKFCNLAADCNPSIIETLFTDPSDVIHSSEEGDMLRAYANHFLSKKAKHTFSGYAFSQLGRIQRHYAWLKYPPKKEPTREDFNLPERTLVPADQRAAVNSAITKKLAEWNVDLDPLDQAAKIDVQGRIKKMLEEIHVTEDSIWKNAARAIGVDDNFIYLMEQERAYNNARTNWTQYLNWQKQRNPARAELEAKFGYDTKHGMHLVRLMRMGYEILTEEKVKVKRPDAEELLAIRAGLWPYEQMVEYANMMDQKLEAAYKESTLPHAPDRNFLDQICRMLIRSRLRESFQGF